MKVGHQPISTTPATDEDRPAGVMLLIGSAALILAGLLHPESGQALLKPDHPVGHIWYVAHVLGVGVWPLIGVGLILARSGLARCGERLLPLMSIAVFVFAAGSAIGSGILGGFVRPRLAADYLAAPESERATLQAIYDYNTVVNETFADAYQVAFAIAVVLWSAALLRMGNTFQRVLGGLGVIGGAAIAVAFLTGRQSVLSADFHVFVLINLACAGWVAALGFLLLRPKPSARPVSAGN